MPALREQKDRRDFVRGQAAALHDLPGERNAVLPKLAERYRMVKRAYRFEMDESKLVVRVAGVVVGRKRSVTDARAEPLPRLAD